MKTFIFAIFAILISTVAAFAPAARNGMVSTQLDMKVVDSIGSLKKRSRTCQVIRRRGRVYLIDKFNPRHKARQGGAKQKKRYVRKNKKRKYK